MQIENEYLNYLRKINENDKDFNGLDQELELNPDPDLDLELDNHNRSKTSPSRNVKKKKRSVSHVRSSSLNEKQWGEVFAQSPTPIIPSDFALKKQIPVNNNNIDGDNQIQQIIESISLEAAENNLH